MKRMTCRELGGACDLEFSADSFDEIAALSKAHGLEMFRKADPAHLQAMDAMKSLMADPSAMKKWFDGRREAFEARPDE
ncbi:MAG: DUF1059 domain-containing protein [Vicinamibacterales bacterium]